MDLILDASAFLVWLRIFTLMINIVFMILLPFAIRLRLAHGHRSSHRIWWLIAACEIAFAENCVTIIQRLFDEEPWSWAFSPPLLVAGICALVYIWHVGRDIE